MSKASQLLEEYESNPNADPNSADIAATNNRIVYCSLAVLAKSIGERYGNDSITQLTDLVIKCEVPEDRTVLLAFFKERRALAEKLDLPLDIISKMCLDKLEN